MDGMNSGLKDCKTVANTYRVFGSKLLSDVYGIADTSYILKDTKEVLGALFKSSVGLFKSDYKGFKYESDMSELASSCVDYEIRFDKDVLSIKFNYKNDNYDFVVGEIAKACVNYEISFTGGVFVVTLDFGVAKERNRIEMILNNRKGGHSLHFFKDGKSKIKLSGGFI